MTFLETRAARDIAAKLRLNFTEALRRGSIKTAKVLDYRRLAVYFSGPWASVAVYPTKGGKWLGRLKTDFTDWAGMKYVRTWERIGTAAELRAFVLMLFETQGID